MTYSETLAYLYASQPAFHLVGAAAYKPGLQNTEALMAHLDHPECRFAAIHIAGTNGKGSTSHLLAAALQAAGLRVGLYTSPHLVDFRERIRISGEMIPEERVVHFVADNRAFLDTIKPSFFETTMALAFQYFAEEKVDVAVIEVGLGGRLDSTNILPPYNPTTGAGVLLSVITNIGMDHTEFLGNSLSAIAAEKAGIMKPNVPCVIGEYDEVTAPVFLSTARRCGLIEDGADDSDRFWFASRCTYLKNCRRAVISACQLHGEYQECNMQTAYVALRALNLRHSQHPEQFPYLSPESIAAGFANVCTMTGLRGRWEVLSSSPLTICDTGHNSHGLRYVSAQLQSLLDNNHYDTLRMVFGMVDDKDVDVVMSFLPRCACYYFTQASTHRAIPASRMREMWQNAVGQFPTEAGGVFATVEEAILAAQQDASPRDIVFIGGSNYVVGEALRFFSR